MGQKPKEVTEGGKITQKLMANLMGERYVIQKLIEIKHVINTYGTSLDKAIDVVFVGKKNIMFRPLGGYKGRVLGYKYYPVKKYIDILDILPKKWL